MECLFCHSTNIRKAAYPRPTRFNNKQFHYMRCRDCGLVFIDPIPGDEDYARMYASEYHDQFYFKDAPDYSGWFELFSRYSKDKSIVDYGCGDGAFLRYFHERGYECFGVEYDPALVERLRKENSGITFYTVEEFWDLDPQRKFNAFFMGDVLEHMARPSDFLKKLLMRLRHGGIMAAQGPLENNRNLALRFRKMISGVKTLSRRGNATHVPYHISFSNARNQKGVFEKTGLQTCYYEVFETTWPFPSQFSKAPGGSLKHLVAKTSIFLSKKLPGHMGNRFLYVGEKK